MNYERQLLTMKYFMKLVSDLELASKQTSEETSCSKTPSEMTGNEVRITLKESEYQSSYIVCPEKPAKISK